MDGLPVSSCSVLALDAADTAVLTIEGLASNGELHSIQKAFIAHGAFQCAYCTSGFIMSSVALLSRNPEPDEAQIRAALSGHICRCGTYMRIIRAVESAARRLGEGSPR